MIGRSGSTAASCVVASHDELEVTTVAPPFDSDCRGSLAVGLALLIAALHACSQLPGPRHSCASPSFPRIPVIPADPRHSCGSPSFLRVPVIPAQSPSFLRVPVIPAGPRHSCGSPSFLWVPVIPAGPRHSCGSPSFLWIPVIPPDPRHSSRSPSFLRRQESRRAESVRVRSTCSTALGARLAGSGGGAGRRGSAVRYTIGGRLDSCLRRNDGAARNDGRHGMTRGTKRRRALRDQTEGWLVGQSRL